MDNALKYSQENQSISVSLSVKGKKAYFAVTDHGVGISADDQKHIFERFYRVDKARSRETGGTGLGLSIVRQLVNLHHGEITVDSMPGQGSTFTVTLPLNGKDGDAR
jgi:signal transduction histidine kinase